MINLILGFLFGLILGSLVDCLADRSLTGKSFFGRSFCPKCKKTLAWFDLFPILSFLSTSGKCRYCKLKIPLETLLVEVLMGFLTAGLIYQTIPQNFTSLAWPQVTLIFSDLIFKSFIICVLVIVFITDIKTGLIPDRITYPSIIIGLFYLIANTSFKIYLIYDSLAQSVLGKYLLPPKSDYFYRHAFIATEQLRYGLLAALLLGGFFLALILITRGRGMGGGDFKLSIFLGLVFGIPNSILLLLISFLSGSIVGVILLIAGKKRISQTIPFGPFLSLGALITLFWGDQLLKWYLNIKLM